MNDEAFNESVATTVKLNSVTEVKAIVNVQIDCDCTNVYPGGNWPLILTVNVSPGSVIFNV